MEFQFLVVDTTFVVGVAVAATAAIVILALYRRARHRRPRR
jgi:hypothetical protein